MATRANHLVLAPVIALAWAAAGCTVGPQYHPPGTAAPAAWMELASIAPPTTHPTADVADVPSRPTTRPISIAEWWATFHDPILDAIVAEALRSNYDLRLATSRVRESRGQRAIAASGRYPRVNASGSYLYSHVSRNGIPVPGIGASAGGNQQPAPLSGGQAAPQATGNNNGNGGSSNLSSLFGFGSDLNLYQLGFDAAWEIDLWGGVRNSVNAADADLAARTEDQRNTLVSLLAEVARDYLELRGTQRRLAIARDTLASQQQTLRLTRERRAAGVQSELDVARAASQADATAAAIPALESQIRQGIHRLGVLLGREPGALFQWLAMDAPLPAVPSEVPIGLPSDLLRRRPDVRRAERELAAATYRTAAATADLFPKFSLTGSAGLQSLHASDLFDSGSKVFSIGPGISWPVFDAGRIRANIDVQDNRQEQAALRYEQAVLTSLREVEDALTAYAAEQVRRQSLADAVGNDRRAVAIARDQYKQGVADFLTVLDAERTLYRSQDTLAQSDQGIATNLVSLYKALGGGWEVGPLAR